VASGRHGSRRVILAGTSGSRRETETDRERQASRRDSIRKTALNAPARPHEPRPVARCRHLRHTSGEAGWKALQFIERRGDGPCRIDLACVANSLLARSEPVLWRSAEVGKGLWSATWPTWPHRLPPLRSPPRYRPSSSLPLRVLPGLWSPLLFFLDWSGSAELHSLLLPSPGGCFPPG
jgi:hypothetical protein